MDFMYYANEDGTSYLFTRDYYYKKDVSAGLYVKAEVYGKIGINEYCEMLLIYGECGCKAKSSARLYRERFPEGPHPTRQTILKVVKRLRESGGVTSRPRVRRPRNVELKVQPEDVPAYALAHPQSSRKMISVAAQKAAFGRS
ncbi:hypothetical protein AVEN_187284-1 [Araneus ventricosus]|uniref:DUF4817 domain-containing protein n=1 Tax=Araneus ventricosus TaxID=182803 RepID=A0A4Y2GTB1_ARAVE|nr:hypothetical protein AVEN_187284-1 [Araneus ventricosus]